jgi:outer membrane lipoprotein-sorting protein
MHARLLTRFCALIAMGAVLGGAALGQSAKAAPPAAPEWNSTVTKQGEFDAKQLELIQKATNFFNQMGDMKGTFMQTSADNKRLRGKIFIKRPSYFRFEYNLPSRQIIISDSTMMAVVDLDLKTDHRWSLDQTPFRVVLKKEVDLRRDARIIEVGETDDRTFLSLEDKEKDPNTRGRLKLFFSRKGPMELKEWITTDSQGLDTRVELTEFVRAEDLDPKLFVPPPVHLQKVNQ